MGEYGLLQAWVPTGRTGALQDKEDYECKHLLPSPNSVVDGEHDEGQEECVRQHGQCTENIRTDSSSLDDLQAKSENPATPKLHRVLVLVCIGFNSTLVAAAISLMMPFFSTVALRKSPNGGIPTHTAIGFIFSISTQVEFIAAPIMAKELPIAGSKFMLLLSATEISGIVLLFGFVNRVESWPTFLVLRLLIRLVQGTATAANFVSASSIAIGALPDSTGITNGAMRAFNGLGYGAGSALGGFLYDAAGYALPFYIESGLLFTNTSVLAFVLASKESHLSPSTLKSDVDYLSILRLLWVWIALITFFLSSIEI